ncbi:hypothetical protein GCM10023166_02550 [Paeniglutamicibacter cryotolerans]|uniref:Uncharacterized protein n=1 Tax=Paeniglutamicibacter cryotolerans TaxID=670079 RepID=A0A839QF78_9MICC|nr:hypothetical protein [Paeniglutamicibacter cryotolerans]
MGATCAGWASMSTGSTKVRYVLGTTGKVMRVEPWSMVFTDLETGTILDVVDGRRGPTATSWIAQRPRA